MGGLTRGESAAVVCGDAGDVVFAAPRLWGCSGKRRLGSDRETGSQSLEGLESRRPRAADSEGLLPASAVPGPTGWGWHVAASPGLSADAPSVVGRVPRYSWLPPLCVGKQASHLAKKPLPICGPEAIFLPMEGL